jgi:alanyl-tRNA synthetase
MLERAQELTGKKYGVDDPTDKGLRVLADHGRSLTFLIADGVLPSNEERGYVLRRVMRRAVRHARLLGRDDETLPALVETTVDLMGAAYPELVERKDFILGVAAREEERFSATLRQGLSLLEQEIEGADGSLPGEVAFKLHDTFGFPVDLTSEIASEAGMSVELGRFEELMTEQRTRARAARKQATEEGSSAEVATRIAQEHGTTEFDGYEHLFGNATVLAISDGVSGLDSASEGDEVDLILDRTVFYAEGGGQVGDRGVIKGASFEGEVIDTRRLVEGLTGHRIKITAGEVTTGDDVEMVVDPRWRHGSQRAHTATHILHWILRDRLGDHARQAGSLVEPGRLRFDFSHFEALGETQLADISSELQERVFTDDHVRAFETTYDFAKSIGAMAIFGEKYGDFVRVVEVGEYSKELCGGTHVPHTSQIGVTVLTSEGSVGSNLRRVEALVGIEGVRFLEKRANALSEVADMLKATPDEVASRIERLLATQKEMERKIAEVERGSAESDAATLVESAVDVDGSRLVVARRDVGVDALRSLAQSLKGKLGSGVVVLGTAGDGKANLVGAVTKDLAQKGISARDLLAPGAALLGGGAGGKPDLAISGGPSVDKIDEAIESVARAAKDALSA